MATRQTKNTLAASGAVVSQSSPASWLPANPPIIWEDDVPNRVKGRNGSMDIVGVNIEERFPGDKNGSG